MLDEDEVVPYRSAWVGGIRFAMWRCGESQQNAWSLLATASNRL